jgi:DNA-binding LytR/AlgR family response regulator
MEREKYNCLVVDDEPIARKIVVNYIEQMPLLALAAERNNALGAIDYLRTHSDVQILFLDINMPNLSGLQLLRIAKPQQPVIFTTAYSEYAVESYELNAADYLLKPFSFERFTKAVYKAIDIITIGSKTQQEITPEKSRVIFIKSEGKNYPVHLDDILYCEAMKNYTMIVLMNGQKLMPLIAVSKLEALLAESGGDFIQTHRSFLISRKHIRSISSGTVHINKYEIPIGVQFKERFLKAVGRKGNE